MPTEKDAYIMTAFSFEDLVYQNASILYNNH